MAFNKLFFENPKTQISREVAIGFCWPMLFFGVLVPVFRFHWRWALLLFLAHFVLVVIASILFKGNSNLAIAIQMAHSLIDIPMAFYYNKIYLEDLIEEGFEAKGILKGTIDELSEKLGIEIPTVNSETSTRWRA